MNAASDGCAWVTGASSGIGRAVALRLARDGWTVAASARGEDALTELAAAAEATPGRIVPVLCDVADRQQVEKAVEGLVSDHGGVALAVLNAGLYLPDRADELDLDAFGKQVNLNLMGTVGCVGALMPHWLETGKGHLAVVSSVAGYRGLPGSLAYGATKAALINFCEGLRFDFDRLGRKVQVVNPGFVKTPLTDKNNFPMPFLMDVDKAADRLVDGLAGSGFEITFPRRFTYGLKLLRSLPYRLYFPLVARATGK
ncbi:MAG: SDR family NAD(P)-dependent oxidoreductase [Inquilinus sp.]|nr:SDR family NAD(P)-dependent oxidoreductase [Inquilinus sp.]